MPRILQKFLLDYTTDWPVLKPSTKGATFCYCCTRQLDFSIGHGGRDDCKRHVACKLHKEHAELQRTCPSVSAVFKQKETRPSVSSVFKQKETRPLVSSVFKQKETCPSVSSVFKQKETPLVLKTTRVERYW